MTSTGRLAVILGFASIVGGGCKKSEAPSPAASASAPAPAACSDAAYRHDKPAFCIDVDKGWKLNPAFTDQVLTEKGGGKVVFTHEANVNTSSVFVVWLPVASWDDQLFQFDSDLKQAEGQVTPTELPGGAGKSARFKNKYGEEISLLIRKTNQFVFTCSAKSQSKTPAPQLLTSCDTFTPS